MRRLMLAAAMLGTVSAAHAADMPDLPILRGGFTDGLSKSNVNWQGSYIGAQGGYGSSDENFNGSTSNMMAALLADTLIESGWAYRSGTSDLARLRSAPAATAPSSATTPSGTMS